MYIVNLFCRIDDFCRQFEPVFSQKLMAEKPKQRRRTERMSLSEVMTIVVYFHTSGYRNFKQYYLEYVKRYLHAEFPLLVSYNRFVEFMKGAVVPLSVYLENCKGAVSGIAFVDSTSIAVCHNRRIHAHRVFKSAAHRGQTSVGWFYSFKLLLVINHLGELFRMRLTPGNVDDRQPVPEMVKRMWSLKVICPNI